jgi:hypothetical protein
VCLRNYRNVLLKRFRDAVHGGVRVAKTFLACAVG